MRRLLLLRHAKAAPYVGRDDYERSLTEGGREDARRIGALIAGAGLIPDVMMFSTAERTRQTAEIVASDWPRTFRTLAETGLYEATRELIVALVHSLPDEAASALVVGHNPGMSDAANRLAGAGADEDRRRLAAKFPPSGLAVLEFAAERWSAIEPRSGRLARFVTPADLLAPRAM